MKILLTTLHAKYSHASLALPCLAACCSSIAGTETIIREYTVNEPREQLLRQIVAENADVIGFSCYIWNIEPTLKIVADLKKIVPATITVLGGPEASFGVFELMNSYPEIDYIIKGEGELPFRALAEVLSNCNGAEPDVFLLEHINGLFYREGDDIAAAASEEYVMVLDSLPSPFQACLVDMSKPLIYYETSRGCPFSCAFCLSSVTGKVRSYSMERIKQDLLLLMERGTPQIKLVDRTFNYDVNRAMEIWRFILDHNRCSHFHFEIAADLLNDAAITLLKEVPDHTFRFEIGVQSASADTLEKVGRKSDLTMVFNNIRRLRSETSIELHLDLVAGLPGEDYNGFLKSLQSVSELDADVLQVEPLKVLKGSPMRAIATKEGYQYSAAPPYTILSTPWLTYQEICRIEVIGRLLDLFVNKAGFTTALRYISTFIAKPGLLSLMAEQAGNTPLSGLSTINRYELFYKLVQNIAGVNSETLAEALFFDFCSIEMPKKGKLPCFIEPQLHKCSWPGGKERQGYSVNGERAKIFCFPFSTNYCHPGEPEQMVDIIFAYRHNLPPLVDLKQ